MIYCKDCNIISVGDISLITSNCMSSVHCAVRNKRYTIYIIHVPYDIQYTSDIIKCSL